MTTPKLLNAVIEVRQAGASNELRLRHLKPKGRLATRIWQLFTSKVLRRHPDASAISNRLRVPVIIEPAELNRWLYDHASMIPELSRASGLVLVADKHEVAPAPREAVCV